MGKSRSRRRYSHGDTSRAQESQLTKASRAHASGLRPPVLWISLGLVAANVVVYAAVRNHGFVNFDDPRYVSENAAITGGLTWRGMVWAFTTGHQSNWHPLTWLSHMLDLELYGMNPGGHHVTNLFLHIVNTLLLFGVLYRMTGTLGRSGFVAALFAVHPLHVESVAWIAERKDVLSTLFWMLTLWSYVSYVRQPQRSRYVLVVVLFALGLMSKPMLVTLPFVLLLIDYWPLGRITLDGAAGPDRRRVTQSSHQLRMWLHLLREKLPLFALVIVSSIITFVAQRRGGSVGGLDAFPIISRVENALISYVAYMWKMMWPSRLGAFYPFPPSFSTWRIIVAAAILIAISGIAIRAATRHPYLIVGWLWYLGTLVPVIGLVQVGGQSMADRYTYIPLVGLFVMVAWGVPALLARPRRAPGAIERAPASGRIGAIRFQRIALVTAALVVITAFTAAARNQVQHWRSPTAIWEHTLEVTGENAVAHYSLGSFLIETGRAADAVTHLSEAVRINPRNAGAQSDLGAALLQQGKGNEAIARFAEAARLTPQYADAHHHLAVALAREGQLPGAIQEMLKALQITPEEPIWQYELGDILARQRRHGEAIAHYEEALRIRPDFEEAHNNLGVVLMREGRRREARAHFVEALRLRPGYADARHNLAVVTGDQEPNNPAALHTLDDTKPGRR
jgi:Flp pilus assembly protein TadD